MRNQVTLGQRVVRLAMCATVVGAALASQAAHAIVVTVNFSGNALSTVPFDINGLYINVVTGAASTTPTSATGWDLNPYFTNATSPPAGFRFSTPTGGGAMVGSAVTATVLTAGSVIGAGSSFITGFVNANAATPGTNIFGFRFLNELTTQTNYGYVTVQQLANPPVAGSVKILGYSYENSGASITVSAVPETSSVLMMAGGLLAVGALARRRLAANA